MNKTIQIGFVSGLFFLALAFHSFATTWTQSTDADFKAGISNEVQVAGGNVTLKGNTWERQFPASSPLNRSQHTMAHDNLTNNVVLFGGAAYGGGALGDTWVWNGSNWTQTSTANPTPRWGHAMATSNYTIMLFGGYNGSNDLNDTWIWNGSGWFQRSMSTSPSPRAYHAMASFGPVGSQWVYLFGGWVPPGVGTPETWYSISSWSTWGLLSPANKPSGRWGHAMAYDSFNNNVVLFGGYNSESDTWVWDGSNWTHKFPASSPSGRSDTAMAYDSVNNKVVLFGGNPSGSGSVNDTWVWDGNNWTQRFPASSPAAQSDHAMAYDSVNNKVLLFGGDQTWLYDLPYRFSGTLTSVSKDTGSSPNWGTISWTEDLPSGTDIKFQIATNNDNSTWNFKGPNGATDTYYATPAGSAIWSGHNGDRYIKYKAFFNTNDTMITPTLSDISITYFPVYQTKVGNAASWQWTAPTTGALVPSGSSESWQWQTWMNNSGRKVPQGTAPSWTWESE